MRLLAIDLGDKRTGLALADRITRIASPLSLIETPITHNDGVELLTKLAHAAREHAPGHDDELLIGLPINMDGSEGQRAAIVRAFAQRLANELNRPIVLVDERRTSLAADAKMSQSGLTHKQKKTRRDALAAAAIADSALTDPESRIGTLHPHDG
jgi:putative Holliday junction resolvase